MHNHREIKLHKLLKELGYAPGLAFLLGVSVELRWVLSGVDEVHNPFLIFSFVFRHQRVASVGEGRVYTRCNA